MTSTNPDDIALRAQIDPQVLAYVYAGKNIPLNERYISHLARKNSPYDVRGTTILTRVFKDLMLRDKYREAQFAIADNHITPLKIFKVGTADGTYRPTSDDLTAFRHMLEEATYDPNFTLVTHPGLEVQYVGSTGVILPLDGEMDRIEDRVLTGLFTSKAFTHSEGPTYANASVALEVLQQRYVSFRTLIEKWLEIKIFRPICKLQGFEKIVGGRKELILPKVNWDKINLKNNREYQQALENLVKEKRISLKTYFRALDVSFEEEIKNLNEEIPYLMEIDYKYSQPYEGPENINVSQHGKEGDEEKQQKEAPKKGGPEDFDLGGGGGGGMPDLGEGGSGPEEETGGLASLPGGEGGESGSETPSATPV